jgi:hypothetical protein
MSDTQGGTPNTNTTTAQQPTTEQPAGVTQTAPGSIVNNATATPSGQAAHNPTLANQPFVNTDPTQTPEGMPTLSGTHQMGVQTGVAPNYGAATTAQPVTQAQPDPKQEALNQQAASDANPASASSQPNPGNQ